MMVDLNTDIELKSYLIGLFTSDICTFNDHNIQIQCSNKELKDNIKYTLSNYFTTIYDNNLHYKLNIVCDSKLYTDLVESSKSYANYLQNCDSKWHFIRGFFDGCGYISIIEYSCKISSLNKEILSLIQNVCNVPCLHKDNYLIFEGINLIEFLGQLYTESNIKLDCKYNDFVNFLSRSKQSPLPSFKFVKTCPEAISPSKTNITDSGFDLHLIKKVKVVNNVYFYDTGIKVRPQIGYYFDLVARSSISKTGWMLANNVGIIDITYSGSILVCLVKVVPDAKELELPIKLVQLIPRNLIMMVPEEVDDLDNTSRGNGGFGSTDIKN